MRPLHLHLRRPISTAVAVTLMLLSVPAFGPGTTRAAAAPLPRARFEATGPGSMLVVGTYPKVTSQCADTVQPLLRARFDGAIEVGRDTDGSLFVIGELPFEEYLKGIAEVPRSWPMAALKAQVVAARSYALAHITYPDASGDRLGYDRVA